MLPNIDITRELEGIVDGIAQALAGKRTDFATRSEALELLEWHVFDRLPQLENPAGSAPELQKVELRALALQRQLEAANARFVARLRARIRERRFTGAGLARALARFASRAHEPGYDALDLLIAELLDTAPLPEERVLREPEMVAYQPTPGRAILSLLERAALGPEDVLLDFGAGLGHVVILAALLRGARAEGIEIEPTFCVYAQNVASTLNVPNVSFHAIDAREAALDRANVFFMYTPFRGELLDTVLERLRAEASKRSIRVCSYGPCTAQIARTSWLSASRQMLNEHEIAVFTSERQ